MPIKHEWNGTILTITSDSGTSSADLQGAKGATGARGARGLTGRTGGGALIEDGVIRDDTTWSSAGIMDRFAEAFSTSGNPVVCNNALENVPFNVMTEFDVKQEGTGEASPTNIRPIIEYDAINITRCGKNLMPEWENGNINTSNGTDANSSIVIRSGYVAVIPNTIYTISRTGTVGAFAVRCYDKNKNYIGSGGTGTTTISSNNHTNPLTTTTNVATIKVLEGCYYLRFIDYANDLSNNYQMEVGETATAYEPYKADSYSISLGDTCCQGVLDCNTGELTVEQEIYTITGNEGWTQIYDNASKYFCAVMGDVYPYFEMDENSQYCSHYPQGVVLSTTTEQNRIYFYNSASALQSRLCIRPDLSKYPSVESWKAYLIEQYNAGTPIQVVYKLVTPKVYKLEPQVIKAIRGTNTLTTNADNIQLVGRYDAMKTIQELLERVAALEAKVGE